VTRLHEPTDVGIEPAAQRPARRRRPVRWVALCSLVVMLLVGVIFGLRIARGPIPARSAIIGQAAPRFDVRGLRGGRVRSDDYAGQMYVVNFWASWCVPCRQEAPLLGSFAERWRGRVALVGIDWNDTSGAATDFVDEFRLTYTQGVDDGGTLAVSYGLTGVPETYLVTPDGVVAGGIIGAIGPNTLDDLVNQVVAGHTVIGRGGGHRDSP